MSGRYSVSDIMGRTWWRTDDMRDAHLEAIAVSMVADLAVVRDEMSARTVYVKQGKVSVYVAANGRDVDRPRQARNIA